MSVDPSKFGQFVVREQIDHRFTKVTKVSFDKQDAGREARTVMGKTRDQALAHARNLMMRAMNDRHAAVMTENGQPASVERSINGQPGAPDTAFKL